MSSASWSARFVSIIADFSILAASFFILVSGSPAAGASAPAGKSAVAHPLDKVAPLIPRRVLFGNPDKAMARMSHDGKRLAFLAPVDGVLNVWVGPIDDPAA